MLVVMQSQATEEQVRAVCDQIESLGLRAHSDSGAGRTAIGITGNSGSIDTGALETMPGVVECIPSQQALQARQPRRETRKHDRPHSYPVG